MCALQTDAQTVDTCRTHPREEFSLPRNGVALGSDLGIRSNVIIFIDLSHHFFQQMCRERGGGSTAEKNGVDRMIAASRGIFPQVTAKCQDVFFHPCFIRARKRAKIAVEAFGATERNVQIKSQWLHSVTSARRGRPDTRSDTFGKVPQEVVLRLPIDAHRD